MNIRVLNFNRRSSFKRVAILIWPFLSSICFFLYWMEHDKIFSYIGLLFYFAPVFFLNIYNCLSVYYFILPNISMFKLNTDSIALSSFFLIIVFFKMLLHKNLRINLPFLFLLLLYFTTSMLTYYFAQNSLGVLTQEIRVVIDIFMVICVLEIYKDNLTEFYSSVSNSYIYGCLVASIISLLFPLLQGNKISGYRIEAINGDPNYFSLCLAFGISLLLLEIYQKGFTSIYLIIFIMLLFSGLMSMSRGFLMSMVANIILFCYLFCFKIKYSAFKKLIVILIFVTIIIILNDFLSLLIKNYENRIFSEETSGGSGRIEIWKMYLNDAFSSLVKLFFGSGVPDLISPITGEIHVQHNIYLELFTGKGFIGTVVIILIYMNLFRITKKLVGNKINSIVSLIPVFTLAIGFMFLNGLVSDVGIMTIFLSFFATNIKSKIFAPMSN